jgi:hypothetical protein
MQILYRQRPDISKFLHFSFFEPLYYHVYSNTYPSESNEEQGWLVGISTRVGDEFTYKILTKTNKIIYRSATRSALDPATRNRLLSPLGGEITSNQLDDKIFIRSKLDFKISELDSTLLGGNPSVRRRMANIDPKDLIGRKSLKDTEEDGQRFRARVVRAVVEKEVGLKKVVEYMKFIYEVPESNVDEILSYNGIARQASGLTRRHGNRR